MAQQAKVKANGEREHYGHFWCLNRRKFGSGHCAGHYVSERAAKRAVDAVLIEHLERLDLRR